AWNGRFMARCSSRLVVAPFSDCTWREGCFSEMTAWKYASLFRRPAIVITFPTESGGSEKVAVGLAPQFYELWKSFLTLADVPLTPPKRRQRFWPFGSRTTAD